MFVKHPLFEKISNRYIDFEETNVNELVFTGETREYFIYVFGMLAFSGKLGMGLKNRLRVSIERHRLTEESKSVEEKQKEQHASPIGDFIFNVEQ